MHDTLEQRLQRIEARLAALEGRPASPPPAPAPAVPPPPPAALRGDERAPDAGAATVRTPVWPVQPRRDPRPNSAPAHDLERFVGVAVLGRIGIAAVLMAAAYFAQLAYGNLTEPMKVAAIYSLAALLIGAGTALQKKVSRHYVALLWGGGTAACYLAGVAARLGYGLVGPGTGLVMLLGAAAVGQLLALHLRHQALASTALSGGFAAPLLCGFTDPNGAYLLALAMALHGWSAWTESRLGWKAARAIGVLGTAALGQWWFLHSGPLDVTVLAIGNAYLVSAVLPELFDSARGRAMSLQRSVAVLIGIGVVELVLLGSTLAAGDSIALPGFGWTIGALWTAAGLALAATGRRAGGDGFLGRGLVAAGGLLLSLGCFGAPAIAGATGEPAELLWLGGTLALCALGQVWLHRATGAGEIGAAGSTLLLTAVVATASSTTCMVLAPVVALPALALVLSPFAASRVIGVVCGTLALSVGLGAGLPLHPFWVPAGLGAGALWVGLCLAIGKQRGQLSITGSAAAALLWLALAWVREAFGPAGAHVWMPLIDPVTVSGLALAAAGAFGCYRSRQSNPALQLAFGAVALGLSYTAGLREVLDATDARLVMTSVYTTAYSAGLLWLGFALRDARPRYVALGGFGLVAVKVVTLDLAGTGLPLRILVTGVLGLVLLGAAFAYSRRNSRALEDRVQEGSTHPR